MSGASFGFDDPDHVHHHGLTFPVEWFLPVAYLLLLLLLYWRLRRNFGEGGALVRAAPGAWLGTLLPAGLTLIVPTASGNVVLWLELALFLLSMVLAGAGWVGPK